jgi:DNA primase
MIPDHFISDLLTRLDIVDVVQGYVPLKRSGSNHVVKQRAKLSRFRG